MERETEKEKPRLGASGSYHVVMQWSAFTEVAWMNCRPDEPEEEEEDEDDDRAAFEAKLPLLPLPLTMFSLSLRNKDESARATKMTPRERFNEHVQKFGDLPEFDIVPAGDEYSGARQQLHGRDLRGVRVKANGGPVLGHGAARQHDSVGQARAAGQFADALSSLPL